MHDDDWYGGWQAAGIPPGDGVYREEEEGEVRGVGGRWELLYWFSGLNSSS